MNISELKKQIEELEMQVKDLKKQVEEPEQEWPKVGDEYYYIAGSGPECAYWDDDNFDRARKARGNIFRTRGEAEARDAFIQALRPPIPLDEVKCILASDGGVYEANYFNDSTARLHNALGLGFRTVGEANSPEAKARLAAILKYGGLNENS